MKKILFLFLALLLPVLIYFFLKSFGKNEFEVPVLFADSVTVPVVCNAYSYKAPYVIADSVLQQISWNSGDSLTVIVFDGGSKNDQQEIKIHLTRIFTEFKTESFNVVQFYYAETPLEISGTNRLNRISLQEEEFFRLQNCVFLLGKDTNAVIIDRQKRIRGQYNLRKREDADRMIMEEMNILFKRY